MTSHEDEPVLGDDYDIVLLHSGVTLRTHGPAQCQGQVCCIHNPSDHHMLALPQVYRPDNGRIERWCPHHVGHPDPDDVAYLAASMGSNISAHWGLHGCCPERCCSAPTPVEPASTGLCEVPATSSRKVWCARLLSVSWWARTIPRMEIIMALKIQHGPISEDQWKKSSKSNPSGNCVEMTAQPTRSVVRDSKDKTGPVLSMSHSDHSALLKLVTGL